MYTAHYIINVYTAHYIIYVYTAHYIVYVYTAHYIKYLHSAHFLIPEADTALAPPEKDVDRDVSLLPSLPPFHGPTNS